MGRIEEVREVVGSADAYALSCLRPRERKVLSLRTRGFTLREIGRHLHVGPERIRQLENRSLRTLRRIYDRECNTPDIPFPTPYIFFDHPGPQGTHNAP